MASLLHKNAESCIIKDTLSHENFHNFQVLFQFSRDFLHCLIGKGGFLSGEEEGEFHV